MNAALAQTFATRHGTPFHAYDLAEVSARAVELTAALPEGASVCYSFKANPMPAIAKTPRGQALRTLLYLLNVTKRSVSSKRGKPIIV